MFFLTYKAHHGSSADVRSSGESERIESRTSGQEEEFAQDWSHVASHSIADLKRGGGGDYHVARRPGATCFK